MAQFCAVLSFSLAFSVFHKQTVELTDKLKCQRLKQFTITKYSKKGVSFQRMCILLFLLHLNQLSNRTKVQTCNSWQFKHSYHVCCCLIYVWINNLLCRISSAFLSGSCDSVATVNSTTQANQLSKIHDHNMSSGLFGDSIRHFQLLWSDGEEGCSLLLRTDTGWRARALSATVGPGNTYCVAKIQHKTKLVFYWLSCQILSMRLGDTLQFPRWFDVGLISFLCCRLWRVSGS